MINKEKLKMLANCTVERLFLIVFPPFGEVENAQVDIRLGLVLKEETESLYVLNTDLVDLWSPLLSKESIPSKYFDQKDFDERIKKWMNQELDDDFLLEYYDFSKSEYFNEIIGMKIKDIQLLFIEGNSEPFGLKLLFGTDFILSFPNTDGNTIETKKFNKTDNIKNFNHLGKVTYERV